MNRALFAVLTMLALIVPQLAQTAPQEAATTQLGSIQGVLTRAGTSEPLVGANVTLSGGTTPGVAREQAQALLADAVARGATLPTDLVNTALDGTPNFFFTPAANMRSFPTTTTDSSGRFAFANLTPGPYAVRAQLEGYFNPSSIGAAIPATTIAATMVRAQQVSEVALSLTPGGVIAGRVIDAQGNPVTSRVVSAVRVSYANGLKNVSNVQTAGPRGGTQTNDRGEFRLFAVPPGEYFVAVNPQPGGEGPRAPGPVAAERPVRTFHPSTADVAGATPVNVRGGDEHRNVDIRIVSGSVRTISGNVATDSPSSEIVEDPTARGGIGGPVISLQLVPRDRTALSDPPNVGASVRVNPNGTPFEIQNLIAPGLYDLIASVPDPKGFGGGTDGRQQRFSYGRTTVDVGNQNVSGVRLDIRRGVELKGRVTVDGRPSTIPGMQVLVEAADSTWRLSAMQVAVRTPYAVGPDGAFSIASVPEGHFRLQVGVSGPPPTGASTAPGQPQTVIGPLRTGYVADVLLERTSIFENGLDVHDTPLASIEIVVKTDAGRVEGVVTTAEGKPAANPIVLLAPAGSRRNILALFKSVTADRVGRFAIPNVAPGDYRLFAWESIENRAYEVPEFLERYESRSQAVRVTASQATNAPVTLMAP